MDFRQYAARPDDRLDLLTGALLIARDAYPGLDFRMQSDKLDELAAPLRRRHIDELPAALQARAIGDHLFIRNGFRGNTENYYDTRNSFLNDVIERKAGIPISLAVLFVEVARRAGVRAHGVGFPGHFLARVDDAEGGVIVDPFAGGATLTRRDLVELLKRVAGKMKFQEAMLDATPVRHIVARMLMNLRGIYAAQGDYPRLLLVLGPVDRSDAGRDRRAARSRIPVRQAGRSACGHRASAALLGRATERRGCCGGAKVHGPARTGLRASSN